MADKLIKILIEAENKASDQFKQLHKELKKIDDQAKKTAESLDKIGKEQKENTNDTKKNTNETKKNTNALNDNAKAAKDNSKSFEGIKSSVLGSVAAVAAFVTVIGAMAKAATETNKEMNIMAKNAGINASEFKKLAFVYGTFGVQADNVASAFKDIAERVNDAVLNNAGEYIDIGKQLGLDAKSLNNLPIEQLGKRVIEEIAKIENQATRTSFADRLGSEAAQQLVEVTREAKDQIDKLEKEYKRLNLDISPENVKKLDALNTEFDFLSKTISVVNQELVSEFSPAIIENIQQFVNWIAKLREGRSELFEIIKGYGTFLNLLGQDFSIDIEKGLIYSELVIDNLLGKTLDLNKANQLIAKNKEEDLVNEKQILNVLTTRASLQAKSLKDEQDKTKELSEQNKLLLELFSMTKSDKINVTRGFNIEAELSKESKNSDIFKAYQKSLEIQNRDITVDNIKIKPKEIILEPNSTKVIELGKQGRLLASGKTEIEIEKLKIKEDKKQLDDEASRIIGSLKDTLEKNKQEFNLNQGTFKDTEKAFNTLQENISKIQEKAKSGLGDNLVNDITKVFEDSQKLGLSPAYLEKLKNQTILRINEIKDAEKTITFRSMDNDLKETTQNFDLFLAKFENGTGNITDVQNAYNKALEITKQRYGENSNEYKTLALQQIEINNNLTQRQIDNLNYLKETNQITVEEQIAGLDKISAELNKNSEMYKNIILIRQELIDQGFEENINKTNLQIRLNEKSTQDLINVYEEQLKTLDETSLKYLELKVVIKDLKDQQLSEEFQKIDLQMQLHEATIDDVIAKYKALAASTPAGSLENLQARVGQQGAEQAKTDENKSYIQAQLDSENLSYERRNELLTQYQNILIQQRDQLPENTAQYVELNNQIQSLNGQFSVLGVTYAEIASTIADAGTDAFMSWIEGSKSLKDAFKDMALSIIQDFIQMTIRAMIYNAIASAMGIPTGGGGMGEGGGLSSLFSGGGGATVSLPTRHNEGIVSEAGDARNSFKSVNLLQPSKSLSSNERLIIAQKDEYVTRTPTVNSPTGVGSNTVSSPNVSIANYISDRAIGDMFSNSDHLNDTIINIINKNQDKISIR